jgi:hypothetical protein
MVVMEIGYDDDVDEDLRDLLMDRVGDFVDEDTDEVVDACCCGGATATATW